MLSRLAIRSRPSATDRVCKRLRRLVRRVISFRPRLSASLTKSFQTCIATLAQPLKYGRYVIIKCQGRPHASRHKMIDVLMSRPVIEIPGQRARHPNRTALWACETGAAPEPMAAVP